MKRAPSGRSVNRTICKHIIASLQPHLPFARQAAIHTRRPSAWVLPVVSALIRGGLQTCLRA